MALEHKIPAPAIEIVANPAAINFALANIKVSTLSTIS